MSDIVYCVYLRRFYTYEIQEFEVFNRTKKTVTVQMNYDSRPCRYFLHSEDHVFFDTMEEAVAKAIEKVTSRLEYHNKRVDKLTARFQELCEHKAITGPSDGG